MIVMLLITVLQQLTRLPKRLVAIRAVVGQVGDAIRIRRAAIRQHGMRGHVRLHRTLLRGPLVNLLTSMVWIATASTAVARFHVLNGVGAGTKSLIAAHGTSHVAGTVHLHVHVQFVRGAKATAAGGAGIRRRGSIDAGVVDTIDAP